MRLSSFSVVNYRSITAARKIQTNNMTVLVGKNNEGKSNILRALTLAMDVMKIYAADPQNLRFSSRYLKGRYVWERDYPVSLQGSKPNGASSVDLNFELTTSEMTDIRRTIGIRLTGIIPVRVYLYSDTVKINIPKKGTPAFADLQNKKKIIEYVCSRIDFNFIPAVRTETDALRVVDHLISKELMKLENTQEYIDAVDTIEQLQQHVFDGIADRLVEPLQNFLPSVQNVKISVQKEHRLRSLRRDVDVIIDDGTPTLIQQKGDGIKSLTVLAMLNMPTQSDRVSVIAIEEPESHLHPESARQLYEAIVTLAENHQVVLTTHSPLFVNRTNLRDNIIVDSGSAMPVKKIKEVRDVLGTRVSDNLLNAENVLVVEGEDDKIILEKLLPHMSESIRKAIQNGTLVIDYLGGAGNLSYKLSYYRSIQCNYHVLLDNDQAGRKAGEAAEVNRLLKMRDCTYTICNGSADAELEDCLNADIYKERIEMEFGVNLEGKEFRNQLKWSDRVANCFKSQGKPWGSVTEKKVKLCVAESVPADPDLALNSNKRSSIDALANALSMMCGE